ncbi:sugar transferase [Thioclava marina]|uniref:sugar transferase n=1 Tax=Thioclava marina TaxID=1915077 RepID=UPI000995F822|nr:sugar transferase [Thioclava marina]
MSTFDVQGFYTQDAIPVPPGLAAPGGWRPVYFRIGKRLFDLVGVLLLAPIVLPVIGLLWLAVRRDGAAGFYAHRRVGRGGRSFRCWKLRTMVPDAELRLADHLGQDAAAAAQWQSARKLDNDPRVTRLGRFLRATSLDELPQLWNVWRGEMSLVGPRPVMREELSFYGRFRPIYEAQRPGMTGLWQVSGRNAVSYEARVAFDVWYFMRCSLLHDLGILLRTVAVVLARTGQ